MSSRFSANCFFTIQQRFIILFLGGRFLLETWRWRIGLLFVPAATPACCRWSRCPCDRGTLCRRRPDRDSDLASFRRCKQTCWAPATPYLWWKVFEPWRWQIFRRTIRWFIYSSFTFFSLVFAGCLNWRRVTLRQKEKKVNLESFLHIPKLTGWPCIFELTSLPTHCPTILPIEQKALQR